MDWIITNFVEILGVILGLIFLVLEIKENKWLWPVGLFTSVMYIYVFYHAKFYADMSLQFYYVIVSIYGWIHWTNKKDDMPNTSIKHISIPLALLLTIVSLCLMFFISYILVNYTDSTIPYWDSFTTSLSIVATWMLARKILEQWLVWIIVNAVSLCLYIYKGLYPTSVLFIFYTLLAILGYLKWKKSIIKHEESV